MRIHRSDSNYAGIGCRVLSRFRVQVARRGDNYNAAPRRFVHRFSQQNRLVRRSQAKVDRVGPTVCGVYYCGCSSEIVATPI